MYLTCVSELYSELYWDCTCRNDTIPISADDNTQKALPMLLFSGNFYHGHSTNICWSSDLKQTLLAVHIRLKIAEMSEY